MNIVKISGSTAQQMFQYAFYLELCRHDAHARLDVPQDKWIKYRFKLPHFLVATPEQLAHFGKSGFMNRMKSMFCKPKGNVMLEDRCSRVDSSVFQLTDTYFVGHWLDCHYFGHIEQDLREAFTVPANQLPASSRKMIAMLSQENAVVIHVHQPESKDNTCTADYYNWAIANVLSSETDVHFYVFTTQVEWVNAHLEFQGAQHDVINYPADKETTLLPYLYHAHHHIMAATLVSWWAAWLNVHDDKIVIAPNCWGNDVDVKALIPLHWTVIPTT